MDNDHYSVLGVDDDVDAPALRAAYLARMRVHHPDRRPGDPGDRARELNHAYEVLSDPVRRAAYDRVRRTRGVGTRAGAHRLGGEAGLDVLYRAGPGSPGGRGTVASNGAARRAAAPRGARLVADAAYSEDNQRYYRSVSAGLLRIGAAVFAVGVVLILLLSG